MTNDILKALEQSSEGSESLAENGFLLATVVNWHTNSGVRLQLDGQESGTEKWYKCNSNIRYAPGDRVLLAQISGTYVVICKVGNPPISWNFTKLATTATLTDVITKVNYLIQMAADMGFVILKE